MRTKQQLLDNVPLSATQVGVRPVSAGDADHWDSARRAAALVTLSSRPLTQVISHTEVATGATKEPRFGSGPPPPSLRMLSRFSSLSSSGRRASRSSSQLAAEDVEYPMYVMPLATLLALEEVLPHQELMRRGLLQEWTEDMAERTLFISPRAAVRGGAGSQERPLVPGPWSLQLA